MTLRRVSLMRISHLTVGLAVLVMGAGLAWGKMHALSVGAGAAVMLANFHLLRLLVSLLIRPGLGPWAHALGLALLTLKLTLAMVLVAGVLYQFPVAPMSFALGASLLLVAALLEATVVGEPLETSDCAETQRHA